MSKRPSFVKSVRPIETWEQDYLDQDNSYKIAIADDGTGKFVASTSINGHQFAETASERNRAASKLQKVVDKAIDDGVTVHDKE